MDAIRSGWLSKENSKSVFTVKIHGNRWVVLYPQKIVISHEPDGSKPEENREIPLKSIILNSPRTADQPNSTDFSLDCGDRIFVFRAKTPAEASDWKRDINLAVFKCAANEIKHSKTTEAAANPDSIVVSPQAQRHEAGSEIGNLVHFVTYTQINVMHTAERFFKCIKSTPAKQRSSIAKAMGKAMVLWVGDEANSGEVQPLRHHNNKHISPTEVLNIWIRVALARELNTSCKFELQAGDTGSIASSAGSTVNSNRTNSRRLSQNRGSTIMPFRADSPECLFLSSLVNATAIRSQMLFSSLLPVLQPLTSNADGFNYPPIPARNSTLMTGGIAGGGGVDERRSSMDMGDSSGGGGGSVFSRMMHGFRRNSTEHQPAAPVPVTPPTAPPAASKRNSFTFNVRKSLKLSSSSGSSGGSEEDPYQRSINNTRNNIYSVIKELFLILRGMEDSEYPTSLISLVLTVKDLTIDAKNNGSGCNTTNSSTKTVTSGGGAGGGVGSGLHHTPHQPLPAVEENKLEDEVSSRYVDINDLVVDVLDGKRGSGGSAGGSAGNLHDEADLHDQLARFGYSRYYTSCTALLFLRLICPSIINPIDWMIPVSNSSNSSSSDAKSADSGHGSPCAAMIILSHVIGESSTFSGDGGKHSLDPHISGVLPIPLEEALKMIEKDSLQVKSKPSRPFTTSGGSSHNQPPAELNLMSMTVRKGLAEISKALLHISNIACLPRDEMEIFARESLVRHNVSTGLVDKDSIDHYQLTETEKELVTTQVMLANEIQLLYERLGKLARVNW